MKVITLRLDELAISQIETLQKELGIKTMSHAIRHSLNLATLYLSLKKELKDAIHMKTAINEKKIEELKRNFNL